MLPTDTLILELLMSIDRTGLRESQNDNLPGKNKNNTNNMDRLNLPIYASTSYTPHQ
jgi:hypothetical protein